MRPARLRVLSSIALVLGVAEAGRRLLTPRDLPAAPAPIALGDYFSGEEIQRGARYARPQLALGLARAAVDLGVLAAAVRRPPRLPSSWPPALGGAVMGAGLAVVAPLPSLPLAVIARRRAMAVGLITQSWRGWAVDKVKADAIGAALAAGAGAVAMAGIRRFPRSWWLPAAGASVLVGGVFAALAPVLLDPVFNRFTPLPEEETRADVLALAGAAGVKVGEVYSVDASRRTTAANAYVTGLGPTKRVVLFDTLLDRYSRDEVRVVVAHELAHVRHRDVVRSVAYAALVAPALALAVQQLGWWLSDERATPSSLPSLAMAGALVSSPVGVVGNQLSRAVERRADAYSLALTGAPQAFVSFERTIALQNVADLDPPAWVTRLLSTHPATAERIAAAVAASRETKAETAAIAPP